MIDPQKIWASAQLPTLPSVALRLIELSRSPTTDIRDIVSVIKSDPAIVARLLKAANSSFFGLAAKVTSIDHAVVLLGSTPVTALALGFSLVDVAACHEKLGEVYASYWLQSAVQATAARMLAARESLRNEEDLFLAGLLLDLGRLAMLKTIPQDYQSVVEAALSVQRPLHEVETEVLGINHIEVGVELMRRWNLPETFSEAVRWHHESVEALCSPDAPVQDAPLWTTALAAAFGEYFCGPAKGLALGRLRTLAEKFFRFSTTEIDIFLNDLRGRMDEIADLFSVDAQDLHTPAELLAQANEQLALLAISAQAESAHAHARQEVVEHEIRNLEVKHEKLKQQALRDPLTRLYNRQFFDETMAREVQRCARNALPIGVIFFDADRFKQVNDSLGHAFGDEVLKRIAAVAAENIRGSDVLARYGGEEFVILVGQPSEKGLEKLAERIRSGVESSEILFQHHRACITVSVGAALTIPDRSGLSDGSDLVRAADQAMYEAKQAGRNRIRLRNLMSEFDKQLIPHVLQRRFSRWLVSKGALDLESVSRALLHCHTERVRLGELAAQIGLVSRAQVEAIRASQAQTGLRFGELSVRMKLLDMDELASLLALQHENPRDLAVVLARLGLIDASRIQTLLDAYDAETSIVGQLHAQA